MWSACGAEGAIRRVPLRRFERFVGKRRHVVAVNDVVREARVLGLAREQLLEYRAGLETAGVGLVGRLLRGGQRERVENRGLDVLRIAR
jgi:hypothetical protein